MANAAAVCCAGLALVGGLVGGAVALLTSGGGAAEPLSSDNGRISLFLTVLAAFHSGELLHVAQHHRLTLDALLLQPAYVAAMAFGATEAVLWKWLWKERGWGVWVAAVGAGMCVCGDALRKVAMWTAARCFTHRIVQGSGPQQPLVTHGVYGFSRHPGYLGWMIWSVGTQVLLVNPVSTPLFAYLSFKFFEQRVPYEEACLLEQYGLDYEEYMRNVPTRIPFVPGLQFVQA
eukprot:TRINITY_DN9818_c3_g2_i1.p1 TRINITY_DN9818_c3_g2~~TRINITY_DN9818_c3_g2_i1.p1  ORF type:complete len:232 (+),score=71.63 TRINITY_DN9818_c3_g2_i1:127-822(+)